MYSIFSFKLKTTFYFNVTFLAYFLGLLIQIFVKHVFGVTQPTVLYLVPACLMTSTIVALIFGDMKTLFR